VVDEDIHIRNYKYTLNTILMAIMYLHSSASISYRGCSSILCVNMSNNIISIKDFPKPETIIMWESKLGLFKLQYIEYKYDDMVWIADNVTMQNYKQCITIIGIRLSTLDNMKDLILTKKDMVPLLVCPLETSNKQTLLELLNQTAKKHNTPRIIISDGGKDIKSACLEFCKMNQNCIWAYDYPHYIACRIKEIVNKCPIWNQFTYHITRIRKEHYNDKRHIKPPCYRVKGRFMGFCNYMNWYENKYLPNYECFPEFNKFVQENISYFNFWVCLSMITKETCQICRKYGYSQLGIEHLKLLGSKVNDITQSNVFESTMMNEIYKFFGTLYEHINSTFICVSRNNLMYSLASSEIIESIFGMYKYARRGLRPLKTTGRTILLIASRVGINTKNMILSALQIIKVQDIQDWIRIPLFSLN